MTGYVDVVGKAYPLLSEKVQRNTFFDTSRLRGQLFRNL